MANGNDNGFLNIILKEFENIPEVKALAIGGSSSANTSDNNSDVDVYVFVEKDIPVSQREDIIKKYSSKYEAGGEYFGSGDEFWVDKLNRQLDVMYWNVNWFREVTENVWLKHYPSNGYTTAFLYTLKIFEILFDKDGWLSDLQNIINTEYPIKLKENIIKRNMMLMKDKPFASYYEQTENAIKRGDYISVNHRISAFLASYFDIIFAVNELLHPGEKRLIKYALDNCKHLPEDFENNINKLLTQPNVDTLRIMNEMVENLRILL